MSQQVDGVKVECPDGLKPKITRDNGMVIVMCVEDTGGGSGA